jgi:hypothetical protein
MIEWYMYCAINGAAGAGMLSILIGIPKQLEIAVNHRKQNTEVGDYALDTESPFW